MTAGEHLILLGASTRAAAFSALRAGLRPWCADLFADADLAARCPVRRLAPADYPHVFVKVAQEAPDGPWMYTGALENRPALVRKIAGTRRLWGNNAEVLATVRSPIKLQELFRAAGIPHPTNRLLPPRQAGVSRWLEKPRRSAGGAHVRFWDGSRAQVAKPVYYQEFIEGEPCAATYVGTNSGARLLGVTRQLVGESWLHAAPFHYCGSIGPLELTPRQQLAFDRLGRALTDGCPIRGLFGIDSVLCDDVPWPVEVNPRYTASVEVLEAALGLCALAHHRRVFDPAAPEPVAPADHGGMTAKAILFAREALRFTPDGPWLSSLSSAMNAQPAFADIPSPGEWIEVGRPILTFFAGGASEESCLADLRATARGLDRWLFGR